MFKTVSLCFVIGTFFISPAQSIDSSLNMGFETGTLKNWQTYVGSCCPISTSEVKNYKMTTSINSDFYITSKGDTDLYCGFATVSPCGGKHSLRIGDLKSGSKAAKVKYYFKVPKDSNNFTFNYFYALVYTDLPHYNYVQQRYQVKLYDSASKVSIDSVITFPFTFSSNINRKLFLDGTKSAYYYYRTWTKVAIPVAGYAGKTIAVEYEVGDCSEGGHLAYIYIDFSCADPICTCTPKELTAKRCKSSVILNAPPGYETYDWRDSAMKRINVTHTDSIHLNFNDRQTFYVLLTKCCRQDTLSITVNPYKNNAQFNITDSGQCLKSNSFYISRKPSTLKISYQWNLGDNMLSNADSLIKRYVRSGKYIIKLTSVDSNNCRDTFHKDIIVYPQAAIALNGDSACVGDSINLTAKSDLPSVNTYQWTLDNTIITGKNISWLFTTPGSYDVTLTTTTDKGCADTISKPDIVIIHPLPTIRFNYQKIADHYTTITFKFNAIPEIKNSAYLWEIENATFNAPNPIVTFTDTGLKKIVLFVKDSFGCENIADEYINIQYDTVRIFVPSAFTPDNNGLNDVFLPMLFYIKAYNFSIYNRWGEELFHATEGTLGWDGTYQGKEVPQDVYVWMIKATGYNNVKYAYDGTITLLRPAK